MQQERKKKPPPAVIAQASSLGCQEIQDHQWLSVAFWFGGWVTVLMASEGHPFVVLKEHRLIVCDKNKATQIRQMRRKGIPVVIPNLESHFVFCLSINKGLLIGHNVVSFMPVNIHPVLLFAVAPPQFCKPSVCRCLWNGWLVNPQSSKHRLKLLARNKFANDLGLDEATLCPLGQLALDLLQNVIILKNCLPGLAKGVKGKPPVTAA